MDECLKRQPFAAAGTRLRVAPSGVLLARASCPGAVTGSSPLEEFARHWRGEGDTAPTSALPVRGGICREHTVCSGPTTHCRVARPARLQTGLGLSTWCAVTASRWHGGPTQAAPCRAQPMRLCHVRAEWLTEGGGGRLFAARALGSLSQ